MCTFFDFGMLYVIEFGRMMAAVRTVIGMCKQRVKEITCYSAPDVFTERSNMSLLADLVNSVATSQTSFGCPNNADHLLRFEHVTFFRFQFVPSLFRTLYRSPFFFEF